MARGLISTFLTIATLTIPGIVRGDADPASVTPIALERFLSQDEPGPTPYRALRRLDARNERLAKTAWMDVWTEMDASGGFRYTVVAEGGSDYIRTKVFRATLEMEKKLYLSGAPRHAALTPDNYTFEAVPATDGLSALAVTPRRKDVLLFTGSIFLNPDNGDLVRIKGRLAKAPSFWVNKVDIVRWYERIAGAHMPVAFESVANVRLAGKSTFRVTYDYETVNGRRVGAPEPRLAKADPAPQAR
jgi:hypothetical protein